jgi:hypothetical protein
LFAELLYVLQSGDLSMEYIVRWHFACEISFLPDSLVLNLPEDIEIRLEHFFDGDDVLNMLSDICSTVFSRQEVCVPLHLLRERLEHQIILHERYELVSL